MKLDANKLLRLLEDYSQALSQGLDEEDSDMKIRCTFCLMQYGAAYPTTKVTLRTLGNRDYL